MTKPPGVPPEGPDELQHRPQGPEQGGASATVCWALQSTECLTKGRAATTRPELRVPRWMLSDPEPLPTTAIRWNRVPKSWHSQLVSPPSHGSCHPPEGAVLPTPHVQRQRDQRPWVPRVRGASGKGHSRNPLT